MVEIFVMNYYVFRCGIWFNLHTVFFRHVHCVFEYDHILEFSTCSIVAFFRYCRILSLFFSLLNFVQLIIFPFSIIKKEKDLPGMKGVNFNVLYYSLYLSIDLFETKIHNG